MRDLISEAVAFSAQSHKGQVDKGGVPYILHCLHVMNGVIRRNGADDAELAAIAVLHDVVEDTGATVDMVGFMFGERVAAGVDALTKRKGESSEIYLARIKANPDAVYVKISDLQHNMDLNRLPLSIINDAPRFERYMARHARYGEMLRELVATEVIEIVK